MNPNNVFIINGNLTKAPILRETEKGKHYTFLNLAVSTHNITNQITGFALGCVLRICVDVHN